MSSRVRNRVLAGMLVLGTAAGCTGEPSLTGGDVDSSRRTALVQAVEKAAPSVVGVFALKPDRPAGEEPPQLDFFRRFFPGASGVQSRLVPEFGSGLVLDSRGYFLTNHHMVGNAERLWVILGDGTQAEAEVVGTDPNYDLAVIRVLHQDPEGSYNTAPLGSSRDLMVGEWVVALGNPYALYLEDPKPSVTAGVVSALHRDVKITEGSAIYKDMIQTDASINPGNSGGPLVNSLGEVVGINTFIFTQGGGSLGIGFAIPIETAIEVAEELILYGRVRGVWIGIAVQRLSPAVANQLGVTNPAGLLVWSLERGSPAERAGIRLGDIIRAVDGRPVSKAEEAKRRIFGARVGDTIQFTLEREGGLYSVPVTLEPFPTERGGSDRR